MNPRLVQQLVCSATAASAFTLHASADSHTTRRIDDALATGMDP